MADQGLQKVLPHLLLFHRTGIDTKVEVPQGEPSGYRQTLPIEVVLQDGRLSSRRPRAAAMWSLAQSAFVDEDQGCALPGALFLRAGHPLLPVVDLLFVAFSGSSHRPLRAPAQADQGASRHGLRGSAPRTVALDQVGYTRAGPQWGFIAQSLRPASRSFLSWCCFSLRRGLRPARPAFWSSRLAAGTILLHPAGYGLTDYFHLAGDLRLISPLFEQVNGLKRRLAPQNRVVLQQGFPCQVRCSQSRKVSLYYARFN